MLCCESARQRDKFPSFKADESPLDVLDGTCFHSNYLPMTNVLFETPGRKYVKLSQHVLL